MPAIVFTEALTTSLTGPARPVIAYDPLTGESEVILDQFSPPIEPLLELDIPLEVPDEPLDIEQPFRAIMVPRRIRGLAARAPLMPGARSPRCIAVMRSPSVPALGGPVVHADRRLLVLTDFPVSVTTTGAQALEVAREILDVDELAIELQVLGLTGGGSVTLELETGMQIESTSGWVSAGAFGAVSSAPSNEIRSFTNLLRYVRWNVRALSGASPSATFFLSGVARRWSKAS